ncbi:MULTISPECIES: phosphotriesterase [unclassified Mycolicibacterium]|uniref:phosphotriesterase family protein n=1 Tax=unclassified Mycolicibacterium TaxID=2636767 RepID=UPI0012DFDDCE|nr:MULTISPECIES: phosphotriesterase [unclassified Mycolicibacterium]MUL82278.1 phosphotriesterase [Mycolicibacterium sp. CBMA 329]MUL88044.1 phosphotriesterase [Mycolicibacterium sp. CBMA 331]MUM02375.1 phosphotriesterase [Mycolicibacterium sp. CBMA 334]MUM29129.1 phosphotriesterase [Mycolicibacterium sp. CBMA 295]MUM38341.1 phosphotriesterase [Mycolicibacterium sp. CBMA 247]
MTALIHTVLGPVPATSLGVTTMHEHIFSDARVWFEPPSDRADPVMVTMANLGWLRWNIHRSEDNLILDDPAAAEEELATFATAGGQTLVDLTPTNVGGRASALPELSRRTGVNIVVSTGLYVHGAHPDWVESADIDTVTEFFLAELRDGVDGSGILPAIIGEIGTSAVVTDREWRVVRAAGAAGVASGAAVNIHLDPLGTHALAILDALLHEGMSADRVVFSHMDEHLDLAYHRDVADAGAVLEYDTFGAEFYWGDFHRDATDQQRLDDLAALINEGFGDRLVLGCDVWLKITQRRFGGLGYAHLPQTILPLLRNRYGVDAATTNKLFIETPARLLTRP